MRSHLASWIAISVAVGVPVSLPARQRPPDAPKTPSTDLPTWPRRDRDPKPLTTARFLDLTVRADHGKSRVVSVRAGRYPSGPTRLPRYRGRFEILLFAHGLLLDVVRFDLPLGGASARPSATGDAPGADPLGHRLADGISTKIVVRAPLDGRMTHAVLRDTVSRTTTPISLASIRRAPPVLPPLPTDLRTRTFGATGATTATAATAAPGPGPQPRSGHPVATPKRPPRAP